DITRVDDSGLIGASIGLDDVRRNIDAVADLEVPVLLRGETGTGKELVAHAIHDRSPRRDGPFVGVNLGALTPSIAAAELFGAVKGAYTGAVRDVPGHVRRAHGGTLFLDEIGEASAEVQVMLLRTLETREVLPVGGQRTEPVDVRIIAATDADLDTQVLDGDFRAPLLHRLSGYVLQLPPLRARRDDVGRLLQHFLRAALGSVDPEQRARFLAARADDAAPMLDPQLMMRLLRYDWPGNVRQLRNVAQQIVIGSRGRQQLSAAGPLLDQLMRPHPAAAPTTASTTQPAPSADPAPARRRPGDVDEDELIATLRAHRYDLKATARALGLSRTSLYARIEASPTARTAGALTRDELQAAHAATDGDLDAMVDRLGVSKMALRRRLRDVAAAADGDAGRPS
ncbi:MAG: sigma 54-interacting transcriptional regulator, partial [Acidobacteriota bacterium]